MVLFSLFISRDYIPRFVDRFAPLVRTWSQIFPELVEQKTGSDRSVIVLTQKRAARLWVFTIISDRFTASSFNFDVKFEGFFELTFLFKF